MRHRHFNPDRDAASVLHSQWLWPGEQPVVIEAGDLQFDMPRRENNGKLRKPIWVRAILWIVLFPVMVVLAILDAMDGSGDPDGAHSPPRAYAFGFGPHCQAAVLASRRTRSNGFWVRSDRRFAYLRATPIDAEPRTSQSLLSKAWSTAKDVGQVLAPDLDQLPPQPVRLETLFEYHYGQFAVRGHVTRTLPRAYLHRASVYERVVLPDGSGFDFWRQLA